MALFGSIKIRILRDFQSVFTFMVDTFPSCKDLQRVDQWSAVGQGEKHGYNHGNIMLYIANDFFFAVISTNHSNSILVYFIGRLFKKL